MVTNPCTAPGLFPTPAVSSLPHTPQTLPNQSSHLPRQKHLFLRRCNVLHRFGAPFLVQNPVHRQTAQVEKLGMNASTPETSHSKGA